MSRSLLNAPILRKLRGIPRPCARALALLFCGAALSACSTNIGDTLPANVGGLPASAPERPAEVQAYPAVHEMPPPRPVRMLDDDQQQKLEKDLKAARDRQEKLNPKAKKSASPPAAGAKPNP